MAFSLVTDAPLMFPNSGISAGHGMIVKSVPVSVQNLRRVNVPSSASDKLLTKLKNLLLAQQTSDWEERQRDCILVVQLGYGVLYPGCPRTKTGRISVADWNPSSGLLGRLGRVCGGLQNLKADIELVFGTKDDRMLLMFKDLKLYLKDRNEGTNSYAIFNFTPSLADKWRTKARFTGKLSFVLKLNDEAYNRIHLDSLSGRDSVNKKLLEEACFTGDMKIMSAGGSWIPCHKIFLVGQSEVFRAMFSSGVREASSNQVDMRDMTEQGIHALLAYLYCRDIRTAMAQSGIAAELLTAADKYGIAELYETMKEMILVKKDEWFSVAAALQLVAFGKNKGDDPGYKEIKKKAVSMIQSMSLDDLKQHAEFQELFNNPESAMEMWDYFRRLK